MKKIKEIEELKKQRRQAFYDRDINLYNLIEEKIVKLKAEDNLAIEEEYKKACKKKGIPYKPLKN